MVLGWVSSEEMSESMVRKWLQLRSESAVMCVSLTTKNELTSAPESDSKREHEERKESAAPPAANADSLRNARRDIMFMRSPFMLTHKTKRLKDAGKHATRNDARAN